jgi:SAM-dependent methyltransferase
MSAVTRFLDSLTGSKGRKSAGEPVDWGSLRRTEPVSRQFGFDRGTPIDRYYIEQFLTERANDIRGAVLEIGDATYTRRFGGKRVARSDVLHATADNRRATLVGDLASGRGIPESAYDCIILTQTLLCIYDVKSAVANACRALKPGGVVLATVPGISQISRYDMDRWGDFWRFTSRSARRLFADVLGDDNVNVASYGNVLAATAFLHGLSAEELNREELGQPDADYEVTIAVRAVRSACVPDARNLSASYDLVFSQTNDIPATD